SNFAYEVTKECLSQQRLRSYVDAFTYPASGLQIALEWERLELNEVGVVEVPIVLSPPLQSALFALSSRFGDDSVAHLLTRSVRKQLAAQIAQFLAAAIQEVIDRADSVQRTWIQLLFDCLVLNTMFTDEKLKNLVPQIESRIDPFDLSLLSTHLRKNVRLSICKSLLLYSCLLVDISHNKEDQDSEHQSQVVDVMPKSDYPPRISLIPRLGRMPADAVTRRVESTKLLPNKLLANTNTAG
ncbi:hypothetical protein Angca_001337, partial [Angiostrongylus cantonensis]